MNFLAIAQALLALMQLLQKFGPKFPAMEAAALAAYKANGAVGVINWLATLNVSAGQPGPSQAEITTVSQQLSAAHA